MSINTSFTKHDAIPADTLPDVSSLSGKSVVLTGGASGIGEQYMRSFVKAGSFVTFSDLATERGEQLATELGAEHVAFVQGDVLNWKDQTTLFKAALEKSPSKTIDIVIANAGIGGKDDVLEHEEDESGDPIEPQLATLKVNTVGVFYTIKLALYYFPKQPEVGDRDRCIIITSSLSGYLDHKYAPQYNASKHGVRAIMKSLRRSGPEQKIRVNLIAPFIATRIAPQEMWDQVKASGIDFCDVEDAGIAAMHLASDKTINGRALAIVPKSLQKRGYYDLQRDDWDDGDYMSEWMRRI
ncbi:Putative short-chain dehydrogenase/reductase SDR, NAD(P)-binding domain superfamily [Septoria linicola]|uniref:Short-chain dehydrogenase/reductase SDR, NAD(P)-binding domain superfamily n=1 Tax=Septoria linicola TaxID=215465 RepID=A0A9Q9EHJ1_9PEZI|nr:Putative short-chain dehydrogenase/reductase SDR, NAD(P)-binding domain superfamily [Septoria linicola]